jgi:hypothetical protein
MTETTETTEPARGYWVGPPAPWRTPEAIALRRLQRDLRRNYFRQTVSEGPTVRRATIWLLPWSSVAYPGRKRGVRQLLERGEAIADRVARGLAGRRTMAKLAAEIERRVKVGAEIAAALRAELEALPARKPNGLCIIGEDGLRKHQAPRARAGGSSRRRGTERPV